MEGETDLLGNPVAPLPAKVKAGPPVNDMALIQSVLRTAIRIGFVVVGSGERVFHRMSGDVVERTSGDTERAVHQLIVARWLTVGGTHMVRYDRYQGPAKSVLVPRSSRDALLHWSALRPLGTQCADRAAG